MRFTLVQAKYNHSLEYMVCTQCISMRSDNTPRAESKVKYGCHGNQDGKIFVAMTTKNTYFYSLQCHKLNILCIISCNTLLDRG